MEICELKHQVKALGSGVLHYTTITYARDGLRQVQGEMQFHSYIKFLSIEFWGAAHLVLWNRMATGCITYETICSSFFCYVFYVSISCSLIVQVIGWRGVYKPHDNTHNFYFSMARLTWQSVYINHNSKNSPSSLSIIITQSVYST